MEYNGDEIFRGAAALAARGWKIVRLWGVRDNLQCNCGKQDCPNPGKHPHGGAGWQHRATDSEEEIARWFDESTEQTRCNIGVRLGPTSGIIDVEFDSPDAAEVLSKYGLDQIDTPMYSSGRGVHRIFEHEDWMPNSAMVKIEGLEVRIGGGDTAGQSVVPPSWHKTGKQYRWLPGKSPEEVSPARLPPGFREVVIAASRRQGSGITAQAVEALRLGKPIEEGGRHPHLVGLASRLAQKITHFSDAEREEMTAWVLRANACDCRPPKSVAEVVKIAADQFAHYRDRQLERRATRPYERYGLMWNHEDRCWEPGRWKLTVVHTDPREFKLRIPNMEQGKQPHIVPLSSEDFQTPRRVAKLILDAAGRMDMTDPSPGRWASVWNGESVKDENGAWVSTRGLKCKLLEDSDDEYPPAEFGEVAGHAAILLSYISGFQKSETGDESDRIPNHSGIPKWIREKSSGEWVLWIKFRETLRAAFKKSGLLPPTIKIERALSARLRRQLGVDQFNTHTARVGDPPRAGKWQLFTDEYIDALAKIAGSSE